MHKALWIGAGVLLSALAAGWLWPDERTWGVHFLAYLPPLTQVMLVVLAAVVATIALKTGGRFRNGRVAPRHSHALPIVVVGLLFLALRAGTPLLGDGQLWLRDLEAGVEPNPEARAPLLLHLLSFTYAFLHREFDLDPLACFRLISVLSGVATLWAWLRLGRMLNVPVLFVLLMGFAWGGVALFFGYVEMYPPLVAAVSWMLALMVSSLRSERRSEAVAAALVGVLMLGLNHLAVVFLPALIAFLLHRFFGAQLALGKALRWSAVLLMACIGVYLALGLWRQGNQFFLPLWLSGPAAATNLNAMAVLSPEHGLDLLNALVLLAGPFVAIVLVIVAGRRMAWTPERIIVLLALLFPLAAMIVENAQLGGARDWDIAASFLTAIPMAGILLWPELSQRPSVASGATTLTAVWIVLVIVPWIAVQHSETLAIRRFRGLLELDPGASLSGWDYLGSYYHARNDLEHAVECDRQAAKLSLNPRYHVNLARYYALKGDWAAAEQEARQVWEQVSADSVISEWERRITDPTPFHFMAEVYRRQQRFADAEQAQRVAELLEGKAIQTKN